MKEKYYLRYIFIFLLIKKGESLFINKKHESFEHI